MLKQYFNPSFLSADVLSEEVILKWYKDSHSTRGWSAFMEQMKKFVEWLEQADEGKNLLFPLYNTVSISSSLILN